MKRSDKGETKYENAKCKKRKKIKKKKDKNERKKKKSLGREGK